MGALEVQVLHAVHVEQAVFLLLGFPCLPLLAHPANTPHAQKSSNA